MIRRVPSRQRNARIVRESDRDAFLRLGLLLFCGLGLASGFVYAGRQHFTSLNYGYETEKLRRERDQLMEQQHRYLLQREQASSPVRLERAAKQLGMQPLTPAQIDPLRQAVNNSDAKKSAALLQEEGSNLRASQNAVSKTQAKRTPKKPI